MCFRLGDGRTSASNYPGAQDTATFLHGAADLKVTGPIHKFATTSLDIRDMDLEDIARSLFEFD